jgi:hypothetical protein
MSDLVIKTEFPIKFAFHITSKYLQPYVLTIAQFIACLAAEAWGGDSSESSESSWGWFLCLLGER